MRTRSRPAPGSPSRGEQSIQGVPGLTRRRWATTAGRRPRGDGGSALVEFSLVAILLLMLVLGILQVAVYLHVRNVAAASAAEGARYAANADVPEAAGADRAEAILASTVGHATAAHLTCSGALDEGPGGVIVSSVRCTGAIPVFFVPFGEALAIDVSGHSVEESPIADAAGAT
jgi:hypothetical protein